MGGFQFDQNETPGPDTPPTISGSDVDRAQADTHSVFSRSLAVQSLVATRMLVAFFVGITVLVVATLLDLWSGSPHPIRPTDPPARGTATNPRLD